MIPAAVIEAMLAAGATAEVIAAAVKADAAIEEEQRTIRRAKDAERKRRSRAMSRDVTRTTADADGGHAMSRGQGVTKRDPPKVLPPITPLLNTPTPSVEPDGSTSGAAPKSERATRLPADWMPSFEDRAFAIDNGLIDTDLNREVERFANHWHAKPGKDARKLDWHATWRNWVLRATDRRPSNGHGTGREESTIEQGRRLADAIRREELARGIGRPPDPVGSC